MRHLYLVVLKNNLGDDRPKILKKLSSRDEAEEFVKEKMKSMADYMSTFFLSIEEVWTNSKD